MRIVIIGAVAAGTSAAAKARRNNEEAEIVIYEKESHISYSGCGIPYLIGGEIGDPMELTPRNPKFFKEKYNVDIYTEHEVSKVDANRKKLLVRDLKTGSTFEDYFDKLVIATGARATRLSIKGSDEDHVFTLRNINDMYRIKDYIAEKSPKSAVIIGTGFIGLEMAENLRKKGIDVTLLEVLSQVTPGLDPDMAVYVEEHLQNNGISVYKESEVEEITKDSVLLSDHREIFADLVLVSVGVRSETALAEEAGVKLGLHKSIIVDECMRTNIPDVFACGDCIQQFHAITGKPVYRPVGSTANKTGRIAGDSLSGGNLRFRGVIGTGIFRIFGLTVAQTGLSEKEAKAEGYDIAICHNIKPDKPEYMGGREMIIKGIADRTTGRILGAQIIGYDGADKRIDVFVAAISFKAKAEDLFHLDLAYAPPFSTTKDPVMYTGMILDNELSRNRKLMTAKEVKELIHSGREYQIIDVREAAQYERDHVETAINIPHAQLRDLLKQLDKEKITVTYCNKGVTGNAAQNILLNHGFKEVYAISGGHKQYRKVIKV